MRKKIVAGNRKMNTTLEEGIQLAGSIEQMLSHSKFSNVVVIIAPPFTHLTGVSKILKTGYVELGAQNCGYESKGAYTGEVSAPMLKSAGVKYVIIGHSERRTYFRETDEELNMKAKLVLDNGMKPIFCCGESLAERNQGNHFDVVKRQIDEGIFNLSKEEFRNIVIAYEPVWAIGTGVNATPEQAQEMHIYIRGLIAERHNNVIAQTTSILYGGSCKPSNAQELFRKPDVDGGLIGGASLNAMDFIGIINAAAMIES
ncbi:MAG: triose-phosphate isomerase [Bacteroidia bacterium]|nr:triose-phosphate isomerase [Bacteroidia bacterium]